MRVSEIVSSPIRHPLVSLLIIGGVVGFCVSCGNSAGEDRDAFQRAEKLGRIEAYEKYCKEFPGGRHVPKAKARVADLLAFREACESRSVKGYESYLERYPKGLRADEARRSIVRIRKDRQADRQRLEGYRQRLKAELRRRGAEARRRQDEQDFTAAREEGRVRGYLRYLKSHPNGLHAAEARETLQRLGPLVAACQARERGAPLGEVVRAYQTCLGGGHSEEIIRTAKATIHQLVVETAPSWGEAGRRALIESLRKSPTREVVELMGHLSPDEASALAERIPPAVPFFLRVPSEEGDAFWRGVAGKLGRLAVRGKPGPGECGITMDSVKKFSGGGLLFVGVKLLDPSSYSTHGGYTVTVPVIDSRGNLKEKKVWVKVTARRSRFYGGYVYTQTYTVPVTHLFRVFCKVLVRAFKDGEMVQEKGFNAMTPALPSGKSFMTIKAVPRVRANFAAGKMPAKYTLESSQVPMYGRKPIDRVMVSVRWFCREGCGVLASPLAPLRHDPGSERWEFLWSCAHALLATEGGKPTHREAAGRFAEKRPESPYLIPMVEGRWNQAPPRPIRREDAGTIVSRMKPGQPVTVKLHGGVALTGTLVKRIGKDWVQIRAAHGKMHTVRNEKLVLKRPTPKLAP